MKQHFIQPCKRFLYALLFCIFSTSGHAIMLEDLIKNNTLKSTFTGKTIAYYIGSFDPLHLGHERLVKTVLEQGLCDYVIVYPAWGGDEYKNRTPVNIRLEMLLTAFKDNNKVIVTQMNPSELQNALMVEDENKTILGKPIVKTAIKNTKYVGLIGSDVALDISQDSKRLSVFMQGIKVPEKYKENTIGGIMAIPVDGFIVSLREGYNLRDTEKLGNKTIIKVLETNQANNSSTKIRNFIQDSKPIDGFISKEVFRVIEYYKLYRNN